MKRAREESQPMSDVALPYKKRKKAVPRTAVDKSLARRIRHLENQEEVKYSETVRTYTTIPNEVVAPLWLLNCVNTSTLGTAQAQQRVGTQIINKKLKLRMSLLQNTLNIADNRVRLMVFWYKNANTLLPTPNQLFDLGGLQASSTFAFLNDQYKESFQVLYDRTFELKPLDWNGTTTTIGDQISINKTINLSNKKTRYVTGAGAGTYVDIVDNSLWVAAMTSASSGAAQIYNPLWTLSARCFYVDS